MLKSDLSEDVRQQKPSLFRSLIVGDSFFFMQSNFRLLMAILVENFEKKRSDTTFLIRNSNEVIPSFDTRFLLTVNCFGDTHYNVATIDKMKREILIYDSQFSAYEGRKAVLVFPEYGQYERIVIDGPQQNQVSPEDEVVVSEDISQICYEFAATAVREFLRADDGTLLDDEDVVPYSRFTVALVELNVMVTLARTSNFEKQLETAQVGLAHFFNDRRSSMDTNTDVASRVIDFLLGHE